MPEMPMMAGETAEAAPMEEEVSEKVSFFIPKEALGGRECKPGEKLSVTVRDVDEDSGEVEAIVEKYESKGGSKVSKLDEAIDAMPEDE